MRIGNRLFPYPLLNNNKLYSQYKTATFRLDYTEEITDESYTLRGIRCEIEGEFINKLIDDGKAKVVCVVECASTMYRKNFEIGRTKKDLFLPISELAGKVYVSAFVVATENISDYVDGDFLEDYGGYSFTIEKNDIIAVDDGFVNKVNFDEDEDTKKSSIFIIVKDKNIVDETMNVEYDVNKITISLPEVQWDRYENTKFVSKYEDIYLSLLGVPSLVYCIGKLISAGGTLDEMRMDYSWFNSFLVAYKNVYGEEMTDEVLCGDNLYVIAQKIFNTPVTKSIDDLFDMTVGNIGGEENED